jgi:hypothetical protein
MRVVITIEDGPESQSVAVSPATSATSIPQVGGTGMPGPMFFDSMPATPEGPSPDLAPRALALGAISAGAAPSHLFSAEEEPPAFTPGSPGSPGSFSPVSAEDLPAGPSPDYANLPETDVEVVEAASTAESGGSATA